MDHSQHSDEDIASSVQNGDVQLFGVFVDRYENKLKRYARKFLLDSHDSEDLVQNVFIKAFTNIKGFDTNRKFSSWIYRIAHNEYINAIKKRGHEAMPFFDPDTLFPHPSTNDGLEEKMDNAQLKTILNQSLEKLDAKYREPMVLAYLEDMDYQTISEVMHIPISTVGVRLNRGKKILKEIYERLNPKV